MTHIPWFAQCLALARGLIKIICYFYDLVKLVRKHAPTRTARESWLRTSDYKGHALYLQKSAAPMQISCLEHRDNAFCSLAEVVPPTGRIHWRNTEKDEWGMKQEPWAAEPRCSEIRTWSQHAREHLPCWAGRSSLHPDKPSLPCGLLEWNFSLGSEQRAALWPTHQMVSAQSKVPVDRQLARSHLFIRQIQEAFWQTNGRPED